MNDINSKLHLIDKLRNLSIKIQMMEFEDLLVIDEISNLLMSNQNYLSNENFASMVNILVKFIEDFNDSNKKLELVPVFKKDFNNSLNSFISDLIKDLNLKVYFYGRDRYGFINDKFLNLSIKLIKSKKELDIISKKIRKDKKSYNVLMVEDNCLGLNLSVFNEVINYGIIANSMFMSKESIYKVNYGLNYLLYGLEYIKDNNIDKIVVGNSYPLNGLSEEILEDKAIKLNLSSQDLYYSFELLKMAYDKNKELKKCLFGISYYILNHDLSRGDSKYSKDMIEYVYLNLLNDSHNSSLSHGKGLFTIKSVKIDLLIKEIFNLDEIDRFLKYEVYKANRSYYNKINPRMYSSAYTKGDETYKREIAKNRANQHNKLLKYKETEVEYETILNNMIDFCAERDIELEFIVFPVTDYYYEYLSEEFKDKFECILNYIKQKSLKIYDLRNKEVCGIKEDDFIDSDHLAESGSVKITNYLKNLI